jgi:hypothetical protein
VAALTVFAWPGDEASGDLLSATGGGLTVRDMPAVGAPGTSGGQRRLEMGDYFSYYLNDPNFNPQGLVFGMIRFSSDLITDGLHALIQNSAYELFTISDSTLLFQGSGFGGFYAPAGLGDATEYTIFFVVNDELAEVYVVVNGVQHNGTWTTPIGSVAIPYQVFGIEGTALSAYQLVGTLGPIGLIASAGEGTNDVQGIMLDGIPDAGTINVAGFPASYLDFASAASLQLFLESINDWDGLVTVTGGSGVFAISFADSLEDVTEITLDTSTLEQSSRALYSHATKLRTGAPYVPPATSGRSSPMRSHIFRSNRLRASVA